MSYTDQPMVENYLQRELTVNEAALLVTLAPAIKRWIDQRTGSTFDKVVASTRIYEGGGSSVDIDPCTEVTGVKTVDDYGADEYSYSTYEYTVEPANETVKREIVRRSGCFPKGLQRVAVTAKFSEFDPDQGVPQDIQIAATRIAAGVIRGATNDYASNGLKSEALEGHSVSYQTSADNLQTIAEGDPYVKGVLEMHTEPLVG